MHIHELNQQWLQEAQDELKEAQQKQETAKAADAKYREDYERRWQSRYDELRTQSQPDLEAQLAKLKSQQKRIEAELRATNPAQGHGQLPEKLTNITLPKFIKQHGPWKHGNMDWGFQSGTEHAEKLQWLKFIHLVGRFCIIADLRHEAGQEWNRRIRNQVHEEMPFDHNIEEEFLAAHKELARLDSKVRKLQNTLELTKNAPKQPRNQSEAEEFLARGAYANCRMLVLKQHDVSHYEESFIRGLGSTDLQVVEFTGWDHEDALPEDMSGFQIRTDKEVVTRIYHGADEVVVRERHDPGAHHQEHCISVNHQCVMHLDAKPHWTSRKLIKRAIKLLKEAPIHSPPQRLRQS